MRNVSSILTLGLKIFLPTFWTVFFTAATLAFFLNDIHALGTIPIRYVRIGLLVLLFGGVLFQYLTVLQLKRVEMSPEQVFVTNYFRHARYPYSNIEKLEASDYGLFRTITVHFRQPGIFGKKAVFLPSERRFPDFLKEHPQVAALLEEPAKG